MVFGCGCGAKFGPELGLESGLVLGLGQLPCLGPWLCLLLGIGPGQDSKPGLGPGLESGLGPWPDLGLLLGLDPVLGTDRARSGAG